MSKRNVEIKIAFSLVGTGFVRATATSKHGELQGHGITLSAALDELVDEIKAHWTDAIKPEDLSL